MKKAVVIGCGWRAHAHIEAYQLISDAAVVACSDIRRDRAQALAKQYGLKPYVDADEMIRSERPQIVHIATWPESREPVMRLASELNVPLCTVEKPIALGVEDWHSLRQLSKHTRTKFAVCHQMRWQPCLARCRQAIAGGAVGKIEFVLISSGLNIAAQGTPMLNYARYLLDDSRIDTVFANVANWDTSYPHHPGAAPALACLTFENGARCLWTIGTKSQDPADPAAAAKQLKIAAYGTSGRVQFEEFGSWEISAAGRSERGDFGGMEQWQTNSKIAQAGFHKAMFDWLQDDKRKPGTCLEESLHEWEVVLALYQSAIDRMPVELDRFVPDDDLIRHMRTELGRHKYLGEEELYLARD